MYEQFEYLNQTQLGELFGVSSHAIGKWLEESGLKKDKMPSHRAHSGNYCKRTDNGKGGWYYVWHRKKTIRALEKAGHERKDKPLPIGQGLHGPFVLREVGDFCEVLNGDGTIGMWSVNCPAVRQLIKLMNLGYDHGKFD